MLRSPATSRVSPTRTTSPRSTKTRSPGPARAATGTRMIASTGGDMTRPDRPYGSLFEHASGTFLAPAEFKHLLAASLNADLTFVLDQDTYEPVYGQPSRPSHLV